MFCAGCALIIFLTGTVLAAFHVLVGDHAELVHAVEHDVAADLGALGVVDRVGPARLLHQAGQQGGLGEGELGGAWC